MEGFIRLLGRLVLFLIISNIHGLWIFGLGIYHDSRGRLDSKAD
jgi:hypothetical protein